MKNDFLMSMDKLSMSIELSLLKIISPMSIKPFKQAAISKDIIYGHLLIAGHGLMLIKIDMD